ncbi:uncharacterized protein BJ212DRAFT_1588889 [Suillus subaureus]|uniref:Uncharacterized protein n=1 Tax=Suillus subaureus TaxID=48587 RepID=A0A9P7E6Q1_9AGAM|nr:uncharacterized protein BJ212DRAFT_1588889 [Suillus subaureus]KAG1812900.1 hypothetical protein BJ212DRAFT_1588889 [Suillus subaureus]
MAIVTEAPLPPASTESNLSDANGTPKSPSYQASTVIADGTPLPSQPLDTNNRITIIQNNFIAEGATINIFSSNCNGSTVTKLDYVAGTAEPTSSYPPLARQLAPVEYGRESVIFNGNTFGQHVMINIGSDNCTGAVKQTALPKISN